MAAHILASRKTLSAEYRLPDSARQSIIAQAPSPQGKISPHDHARVDRQRVAFIEKHGEDGVKNPT